MVALFYGLLLNPLINERTGRFHQSSTKTVDSFTLRNKLKQNRYSIQPFIKLMNVFHRYSDIIRFMINNSMKRFT